MSDLLGRVLDEDQIYYPDPLEGIKDRHVAPDAAIAQSKINGLTARLQQLENAIGAGGGGGGSSGTYEKLNPAQYPNFVLTTPIALPSTAKVFIRGIKQEFGTDYVFQTSSLLKWVGSPVTVPDPIWEVYS